VILEPVAGDVVDGHPLLVLDVAQLQRRGVVRRFQRHAAVALHPVAAHVVAVGHVDLAVRMEPGRVEERVVRQRRLVDAALGVEGRVGVGRVGPARRHVLGAGRDAVVALDLVVARRRPARDLVRAEVEHVEGRVLVEEELRCADEVLGTGLDREPRLGVVRVERTRSAGPRRRDPRARRHRIPAARRRRTGHDIRERHARIPCGPGRGGRRYPAVKESGVVTSTAMAAAWSRVFCPAAQRGGPAPRAPAPTAPACPYRGISTIAAAWIPVGHHRSSGGSFYPPNPPTGPSPMHRHRLVSIA
jgi:hypothetical protein